MGVRNMMGKLLPGLNLLTLLTIAGGQIAIAETGLAQDQSGQQSLVIDQQSLIVGQPSLVIGHWSLDQFQARMTHDPGQLTHDQLRQFDQPTATVSEWLAQIEAASVQITGVRLEQTEAGLQVVLETAEGELAPTTPTVSGNALIAEISNAVLALPERDEFQQFDPAEGIALVQVTEQLGDRVQVVVTGTDAAPTAEVNTTSTGLMLSIVPGIAQVGESDEPLRIVVTGEEGSLYVEPTAATGARTDTPLRDIPQSIQVIPQEVLEDQQVFDLADALRNVSGVTPNRSNDSTGQRFIVRGFENTSVLRDGFRLSFGATGAIGDQELSNIEQIEVLKGPAAILFGVVEPGGVINLVTEKPLSEPFYNYGLRVGNRELVEPSLDISGPLSEDGRWLYRLNALYRNEDYFRDFDTDDERYFIAPVVSWQVSDRTDLTLNLEYVDEERPADFGLVAVGDEVADIPLDRNLGEPDDFVKRETLRTGYAFEHRFNDSLTLRNAFSFYRLEQESLFTSPLITFSPFDESTGELPRTFSFSEGVPQETFDLQTNLIGEFNTGDIEHTVLAGVDLFRRNGGTFLRGDLLSPDFINIFDPVYGDVPDQDPEDLPIIFDSETQTDALGVYIQDQVTLLNNLKLLAGVRYDTAEQETINNPSLFIPTASESTQNDDAFSPRFGVVYQPIEAVSLFTSYSRSFSPNTGTTVTGDILEPEEGEQFEVGAKAELLDGRFSVSLAYFDITLQNVATTDPDAPNFSVATGKQRSQGVELDLVGQILPGWNLIANYAYTDARITEDNTGLEGNRLFNVPEHNFNLWATYDIQNGPLEGVGFGLGFNYVSDRYGDNANSFKLGDYFLTNAALSYGRDNWRAGLNIR
ncbi:MAG: TonB-dependent siderophore receptor, partial [Pseudanabaenales cyanobacterium]|nr:TonB-dependent siderophore receptor [Pseudanabaenales cyanobacterium]